MNAIALSDATAGSRYCICEIKEENRLVNRLSSMGLLCGSTIEVCQNHKKQLLELKFSQHMNRLKSPLTSCQQVRQP